MQIRIDEIQIKKRVRKSFGDLAPLMESMRRHGLLNPIVINKKRELIAGQRRLECAKRLGWQTIEAHMVEASTELEKLELEMDENIHRRNLSPEELSDGYLRLERLMRPPFLKRLFLAIVNLFKKLFKRKRRLR
jgi:ParB family chromosome partitioning protein